MCVCVRAFLVYMLESLNVKAALVCFSNFRFYVQVKSREQPSPIVAKVGNSGSIYHFHDFYA